MSPKEQLTAWLNDAYSMEKNLVKVLENHAKDAKEHPEIRERDERHAEETRRHAEDVKRCLEILGESPSKIKSAMGNVIGMVQGASTGMFRDELVKNFLSDSSAEHFEIACYRSLIAAAEELNQPEIAGICRTILADEEAMAEWIGQRIPNITQVALREAAHA